MGPMAGLPQELVRAILFQVDLDEEQVDSPLPRLLLVSKATKAMVEELHPSVYLHYQQRIAEHLVKEPSQVLALDMFGSPALAKLKKLSIRFLSTPWCDDDGDSKLEDLNKYVVDDRRLDSLNALMSSLCPALNSFSWELAGRHVSWGKLDLGRSSSLRELHLTDLPVMDKVAVRSGTLPLDLSKATSIQTFSMGHGDYWHQNDVGSCPLARLPPNVQKLCLSLAMKPEELERLRIPELSCLTELDLSRMPLGEEHLRILQVGISGTFRSVNLSHTRMGNAAVRALRLDGGGTLEVLDISHNNITSPSLLQLGHNASLRTLAMRVNPMQNLEFALDRNTTLRALDLNRTGGEYRTRLHFRSLSQQLAENTALEELNLRCCGLSDAILEGFELGPRSGLRLVDLQNNNDVSQATATRLLTRVGGLEVKTGSPSIFDEMMQGLE